MRKEFKIQGTRYMARIWRRKRYCKERRQKKGLCSEWRQRGLRIQNKLPCMHCIRE
jgi:hypothetical protein